MSPGGKRAAKKLGDAEIATALQRLDGWVLEGKTIRKLYTFKTFADGIRFVNRIAPLADAMDHHPDIDIRYTTIVVALSTHSAGGLTARDLDLAGKIDKAVA